MNHEAASLLLTDFVAGRLARGDEQQVADHARSCAECASRLETIRLLAAGADGGDGSEPGARSIAAHPATEAIVHLVVHPEDLGEADRSRIATHAAGCAACAEEIDLVRRVHGAESRSPVLPPALRGRRRMVLAACAALLALLYPAWIGLTSLQRLSRRAAAMGAELVESREAVTQIRRRAGVLEEELSRLRSWSGLLPLRLLSTGSRSGSHEPSLSVEPGQPVILLSLIPSVPAEAGPADRYIIDINGDDGIRVWSIELTAGAIRNELHAAQVLVLAVPAGSFRPGLYRLTMSPAGHAQSEPMLETRFRIVPAS